MSTKLEFAKFPVLLQREEASLTETISEASSPSFGKGIPGAAGQGVAINQSEKKSRGRRNLHRDFSAAGDWKWS
jgi:hypothetical protein